MVQYIYTLGAAGERLKVEELDRTVEYTYDNLYRLTSETITDDEKVTTYTYAYDNVSNRILKTENGKETEYVYNSLNQLVSDSETTYEYDLNGNLIRVVDSAHSALYEYNAENKLVKATVQNGSLVIEETYTYDYLGNRTSKTTRRSDGNTEYVKYLNDNSSLTNVIAEIDETGAEKCVYTIGADLISQEREDKVSVYIYDGHGSVVGLATMSGKVTDTYVYDAFGNLLKSTGRTANNYRYCGEQFDGTTELYYLRARYMDTSTGRFISQDSYQGNVNDPVSLHKYLYANSNPVMYSDPSGYTSTIIDTKIGIVGETIISIAYQMANASAMKIGLSIFAAVITIADYILLSYLISDFLISNINDIASGGTTSADANAGAAHDSLTEPFDNTLVTPFPKPEPWIETFPIPEPTDNSIYDSVPEPYNSSVFDPIPFYESWIESFPIPSERPITITYYKIEKEIGNSKAPKYVTPSIRILKGQWVNGNRVEPWIAYYDEYGRWIARTDYNAGNSVDGIPSIHHHINEWNSDYPEGHQLDEHFPGEYKP